MERSIRIERWSELRKSKKHQNSKIVIRTPKFKMIRTPKFKMIRTPKVSIKVIRTPNLWHFGVKNQS
jgi:hypothetical protein